MKILRQNNNLIYTELSDFDLLQTLECGQFFRYTEKNGIFTVFYRDKCRKLSYSDGTLTVYNCDDEKEINDFFDLERDYGKIKEAYLKLGDIHIANACKYGGGIRILKQDVFETLITFIISQNNNIPRIKGITERLCETFGKKIDGGFAFPTPDDLKGITVDDLAPLRCGFRAKYIVDAVEKVCNGEIDLESLKVLNYEEAKAELMRIKGVGEKVANCVLLFGAGHLSAFPIDVWIKKTINHFYGDDFNPDMFGDSAGIAQQYLFYYARNQKII